MSAEECTMAKYVGATIASAVDVMDSSYYGSILHLTFTDGRECDIVGAHQYGAYAYGDE